MFRAHYHHVGNRLISTTTFSTRSFLTFQSRCGASSYPSTLSYFTLTKTPFQTLPLSRVSFFSTDKTQNQNILPQEQSVNNQTHEQNLKEPSLNDQSTIQEESKKPPSSSFSPEPSSKEQRSQEPEPEISKQDAVRLTSSIRFLLFASIWLAFSILWARNQSKKNENPDKEIVKIPTTSKSKASVVVAQETIMREVDTEEKEFEEDREKELLRSKNDIEKGKQKKISPNVIVIEDDTESDFITLDSKSVTRTSQSSTPSSPEKTQQVKPTSNNPPQTENQPSDNSESVNKEVPEETKPQQQIEKPQIKDKETTTPLEPQVKSTESAVDEPSQVKEIHSSQKEPTPEITPEKTQELSPTQVHEPHPEPQPEPEPEFHFPPLPSYPPPPFFPSDLYLPPLNPSETEIPISIPISLGLEENLDDAQVLKAIREELEKIKQMEKRVESLKTQSYEIENRVRRQQTPLFEKFYHFQYALTLLTNLHESTDPSFPTKIYERVASLNQTIQSLSSIHSSHDSYLSSLPSLRQSLIQERDAIIGEFISSPLFESSEREQLIWSLVSLHKAIHSGSPFSSELSEFQQNLSLLNLQVPLEISQRFSSRSVDQGVSTRSSLVSRFDHVKKRVREVSYVSSSGGLGRHMISSFLSHFLYPEPVSVSHQGAHPEFILARATAQLRTLPGDDGTRDESGENSFSRCLEEMKNLKGVQHEVAKDWIEKGEDHLKSTELLSELTVLTHLYLYNSSYHLNKRDNSDDDEQESNSR